MNAKLDDKYALAEKIYWNGKLYNSHLELLWNTYFEEKGINFEHETERRVYDKEKNLYYTPDFTLVNFLNGSENLYVEIKPEFKKDYLEEKKYDKFIQGESGKRKDCLLLICGFPWGVYSKNFTYKLYARNSVGTIAYNQAELKEHKGIYTLLDFKLNKDIYSKAYLKHYNKDEQIKKRYQELCSKEGDKSGSCYKPRSYFLNMVNYFLNGTTSSFKWQDVSNETWKVADERFNDLERFIKYGFPNNKKLLTIDELANFGKEKQDDSENLKMIDIKFRIPQKYADVLFKIKNKCGGKKGIGNAVKAIVKSYIDNMEIL